MALRRNGPLICTPGLQGGAAQLRSMGLNLNLRSSEGMNVRKFFFEILNSEVSKISLNSALVIAMTVTGSPDRCVLGRGF